MDPSKIAQLFLAKVKQISLNQERLKLLTVDIDHDADNSRIVVEIKSQLGVDLPGDTLESMAAAGANLLMGNLQKASDH